MGAFDGHVVIENDHGRAVVSPLAGASLRSLAAKRDNSEFELICDGDAGTLDPRVLPHGTGSFIMAPWPNRMPGGLLIAPDGEHVVKDDSGPITIHGLVRDKEWKVASQSSSSARFEIEIPDAWPYRGKVIYEASLDGPSFVQSLTVESVEKEFPAGVGWHPWFRHSLGSGGVSIKLDAIETWVLDEEMTPSGETSHPPLLDAVRSGSQLAAGTADDCFRISPGAHATLNWPELTLDIASSETINHVMVYTPPDGSALCVEPQTTCVNAFQLHARGIPNTGTRFASPGKPLAATTTWSWR